MSAGLAASTVTPGRTAPEASLTVPGDGAEHLGVTGQAGTSSAASAMNRTRRRGGVIAHFSIEVSSPFTICSDRDRRRYTADVSICQRNEFRIAKINSNNTTPRCYFIPSYGVWRRPAHRSSIIDRASYSPSPGARKPGAGPMERPSRRRPYYHLRPLSGLASQRDCHAGARRGQHPSRYAVDAARVRRGRASSWWTPSG